MKLEFNILYVKTKKGVGGGEHNRKGKKQKNLEQLTYQQNKYLNFWNPCVLNLGYIFVLIYGHY